MGKFYTLLFYIVIYIAYIHTWNFLLIGRSFQILTLYERKIPLSYIFSIIKKLFKQVKFHSIILQEDMLSYNFAAFNREERKFECFSGIYHKELSISLQALNFFKMFCKNNVFQQFQKHIRFFFSKFKIFCKYHLIIKLIKIKSISSIFISFIICKSVFINKNISN